MTDPTSDNDLLYLIEQVMEADPALAAIIDAFKESYKSPAYGLAGICSRCGVKVMSSDPMDPTRPVRPRDIHNQWHRNLSFAIYLLQGGYLSMRTKEEGQ